MNKFSKWMLATAMSTMMLLTAGMAQDQSAPPAETAAGGEHGGPGGGKHMEKMFKDLNLTDAQKAQVKDLHNSTREQMKALKQDQSLTKDQKRERMKALHLETQSKMSSILTPEQQQKMKEKRAQFRKEHKGRHRHKEQTD